MCLEGDSHNSTTRGQDDSTVAWYPNDGTGKFPEKIVISAGDESSGAYSLVASDIDQDGHTDLVVASNGNDHVSLWRNDGHGNFTKTLIYDEADFVLSVTAIDFDRDGDIDVASASFFDGRIIWYENVDGKGYEWKNHTIYVGIQGHYVSTGDMDGDGDLDLIAVTHAENTVAVYFANTSCDDESTPRWECCSLGTQWNGTSCQVCPHGTYGTGIGTTAECLECPTDVCVIPGLNVVPATCSGITGCADIEAGLTECSCEENTEKDPTTDACTPCPQGQIRAPTLQSRGIDTLGNYTLWEIEQGVCVVDDEDNKNTTPMIVGLASAGVLALVVVALLWLRQRAKANSLALWTIDKNEIHYDDPVAVIGKGAFGEVLKGRYRGTEVAVKRVIPLKGKSNRSVRISGFGFGTENNQDTIKPNPVDFGTMSKVQFLDGDLGLDNDEENPGLTSKASTNAGLISTRSSTHRSGTQSGYTQKGRTYRSGGYSMRVGGYKKIRSDFIMEMRQLSKLRHPNITTTMGAVMSPGEDPLLVMEYMHNGSLYDAIRNDSIDLDSRDDILTILQDIAHGLRFLHSAKPQVIHGDLKSKNVLIDSNFRAKVCDFGMTAKAKTGAHGTPYWMAPELLLGTSTNNAMSDIYAFGILLYEVYSRRNPYEGEDYHTVIHEVCDPTVSKRPPVPALCPASVASMYKDCLVTDPDGRPSAEMIDTQLQKEGTIQGRVFRIEALNKELAENNRRITTEQATQLAQFASMSHEIRTPLNCILGVSSLLEDDESLQTSQLDLVKMIVSSGNLLRQVVDDVLDFSKLISGNAEIDIKRTDLQVLINNIATSMKLSPITERKHISIQTFSDPNVPQYVETDERRLQQILYNLLSNAVKFSNEKSMIDLSVSVVEKVPSIRNLNEDEKTIENTKQRLRISVKDYGKGIAEADFDKIFKPFQQTETGISNVDGGTGLGLAITKQLTELLGGSISVDSKLGEWTEFSMNFPLTGSAVNSEYLISRLSKCCIWLISDSEKEIQYTHEICRYFQIQCFPFQNLQSVADTFAPFGSDSFLVCLVQDDLYDDVGYTALSKKSKSILVTFGSSTTRGEKIDRSQIHYPSLTQVFPSVLAQQLIQLCDHKDPSKKKFSRRRSSIKLQSTTTATTSISYPNLNVLVAEDNLVNQKVLKRLLQRLGVSKIQVVSNGQQAVDLEAQESFDIIFMDIQMPVMDGIEACEAIMAKYKDIVVDDNNSNDNNSNNSSNNNKSTKQAPQIVFLSAHVLDDIKSMCIDHGATDYMTKPCTLQDLREKLGTLTGQEV